MKTLHKKMDPWQDEEDRYVGMVFMVQPIHKNVGKQFFNLYVSVYEDLDSLMYSTPWHEWTTMRCEDERVIDDRISYIAFTITNNKAKGTQRIIKASWIGDDEHKKFIDNPEEIWDALPRSFNGEDVFGLTIPMAPSKKSTTKATKAPSKRIPRRRKKAAAA